MNTLHTGGGGGGGSGGGSGGGGGGGGDGGDGGGGGGGGDDDDDSDKVCTTIERVIAGCSSLSESTYIRRHNQLAKIIH